MNFHELSNKTTQFLAMTGYTLEEFMNLLPHFKKCFNETLNNSTLRGKIRIKRKYCGYKNSPLPEVEDNLLFILIYLKQGMTQEALATLFGMYQSDANKRIHFLHPILNNTLKNLGELPARNAESLSFDPEDHPVLLHDGTERPIVRPKNKDSQECYYSGKKKQHTVKNVIITNAECRIIFLSNTCEGKKHDKKIADETGYNSRLPSGSTLLQDTGFQGFDVPGSKIIQPKKKPRGGQLTEDEKQSNRKISQVRIWVEHAISGVKRYRTLKDKIRNWKNGFRDLVMETCCGLHNFRLRFRPWIALVIA